MNITITPNPECKTCHGGGMLAGDWVPYGSTVAQLPADYCDCVIEQLPDDDDDGDIELKLADEVIQRAEAAAKAEAEFFQRMEEAEPGDEEPNDPPVKCRICRDLRQISEMNTNGECSRCQRETALLVKPEPKRVDCDGWSI